MPHAYVYHMVRVVNEDGTVVPLCAKGVKVVNLRLASWTKCQQLVTCKRCRVMMAAVARERMTPRE